MAQIKRYDHLLDRRFEIIKIYEKLLNPQKIQIIKHHGAIFRSSGHLLLCNLIGVNEKMRDEVIIRLANKGVATNVHYKPLPMFTAYKTLGFDIKNFPNAYKKYSNVISLPLHTMLSNNDLKFISLNINSILN